MARRKHPQQADLDAAAKIPFPCIGETYLSWGLDGDPDAPFVTKVECDGGPKGDCGWSLVLEEGDPAGGITASELRGHATAHHAFRKAKRQRNLCQSHAVFFSEPEWCALLPGHEGRHITYLPGNETGAWEDEHAEPDDEQAKVSS